ncbi:hypothetical protein ACTFIV_002005 [Dictyostelium citrinum]
MKKLIEIVKRNKIIVCSTISIFTIADVVYVADFQGKNKDLPSYSPFVLKVISILEYCKFRYEIDTTGKLGPNPRGTLPFIRYNDLFMIHVNEKMHQSIGGNIERDQAIDHIIPEYNEKIIGKALKGSKKFIFSDHLSMANISMFACLAQIYNVEVADTQARSILLKKQNLVQYVQNVKSTIFSDTRWELLKQH